jgi:hypothetical protein
MRDRPAQFFRTLTVVTAFVVWGAGAGLLGTLVGTHLERVPATLGFASELFALFALGWIVPIAVASIAITLVSRAIGRLRPELSLVVMRWWPVIAILVGAACYGAGAWEFVRFGPPTIDL